MNLGTAQVIRADSRHLPLADNSVDLVVTSPPYFALRSYQDGGEHYAGQIGSEPTPAEFVDALLEVTRECVRVLKPSGSLWVNLGDKYSGAPSGPQGGTGALADVGYGDRIGGRRKVRHSIPNKSLMGIPWRYALRCIDDLDLILRAEVIWSKPNGLPESVTDRVRRSHEVWFHFTLEPRYFSAVDEIREEHKYPDDTRHLRGGRRSVNPDGSDAGGNTSTCNPLGKLPGSVWTVPTEPLRVPDHLGIDHFAAFPTEWPRRIIQGWSPAGVCVECGEGRRPVVDKGGVNAEAQALIDRRSAVDNYSTNARGNGDKTLRETHKLSGTERARLFDPARIISYACACSPWDCHGELPPTQPAIVLDPFGGTGTTALVAKALGRHGVSVDMSADYCRLAEWRTNDRNQLAKVLGVEKQPEADADQLDLFEGGAA